MVSHGYVSPADQPTPKLTQKKKIGAVVGGSNDAGVVTNVTSITGANNTASAQGNNLLYHKSMLAYPLITTTSRVKSTGSGGRSSTDEEEEATLVSNLTDPTALKRSNSNLDGDAANFVGASADEQKMAANQVGKETDHVLDGHGADDEDDDDDEVEDHGTINLDRPVALETNDANSHATPSKSHKLKTPKTNPVLTSRPPPHPTTPASHATGASETYCYLTVPHSSDATKVSSLGDMDSPCRQALIREFTARFGHGPNSQIIDDGFIKGAAAGQNGGNDGLVDFVESADGCQGDNKLMMDNMSPALVAFDPIETERTTNDVGDRKMKKNGNSRAMLSYRPSTSSSHQRRQEESGSATSAATSNISRDPASSSYGIGSDPHQSDTSGWVSPNDSPGQMRSPRSGIEGSSDLDFDDYNGQGGGCMASSDCGGSDPEDEISRSRLQAEKEEGMLESILNDSSPASPHIRRLAPPSPQSLEADDEISRCRDELDHQTASSFNDVAIGRDKSARPMQTYSTSQYIHRPRTSPQSGRIRQETAVGLLDSTELESQTSKYNKLGADLISRGKMSEAQSIFRKAISCGRQEMSSAQRRMKLLRENHSIDFTAAEEVALNDRVRVLAAHVADSLNNLGVLYDLMNDYDAAVASCENALDLYLSTAGRRSDGTDRDVERTVVNIDQMEKARSTWPQRKRLHQQDEDAARNIQRCVDSAERKRLRKMRLGILGSVIELERNSLGENHPQVARTLLARGLVRIKLGHAPASVSGHGSYANGLAEIRNAVHIYRNSLGDKHPDVARAVAKLAEVYQRRNSSERSVSKASGETFVRYDQDRALGLYQLSIKILQASKGNGNGEANGNAAEIAFLLDCVGNIHQNKRNFPKAIETYSSASAALGGRNRQVRMRRQGSASGRSVMTDDGDHHHPLMARIWYNLGNCLFRKRDSENALDAYEFCLIVIAQNRRKREITGMVIGGGGSDGFDTGTFGSNVDDYNYSSRKCSPRGDADLAIVPVFSELDDSILTAQVLLSTGKAQSELGWHGKAGTSYDEAGRVSERCLKMLKSCKDSNDEDAWRSLDVAKLFEGLGDVWSLKGSTAVAMEYYDKCTGLHRTIGGDDYLAFARLLGKKSALHMKNGQYREAVGILSDVIALFKTNQMPPNHPDLLNVTTMLRDARNAAERSGMSLCDRPRGDSSTTRSDRRGDGHGHGGRRSSSARKEIPPLGDSASAASSASIDLAFAFDKKAEAMRKAHRYDEAMEACQGALKIRHAQVEEATMESQKRKIRIDIGRTMRNQAFLLNKMGEFSRARSLYCEALDLYRLCDLPPNHPYCLTAQRELDGLKSRVYGY